MKSNEFIEKNPELFNKAQNCKSLDEFLKLAKENNIEFEDITLEEAYNILNGKHEISDDLLDNVAGGAKRKKSTPPDYPTKYFTEAVDLGKNAIKKLQ